jgi:hypothetical protein
MRTRNKGSHYFSSEQEDESPAARKVWSLKNSWARLSGVTIPQALVPLHGPRYILQVELVHLCVPSLIK